MCLIQTPATSGFGPTPSFTSPFAVNNGDAARQLRGVILCQSMKTKNKLQVHLQVLGDNFFFWQQAMHAGVRESVRLRIKIYQNESATNHSLAVQQRDFLLSPLSASDSTGQSLPWRPLSLIPESLTFTWLQCVLAESVRQQIYRG